MEDKARLAAIVTLYDMEVNKSYSNIKINQYFQQYDLNGMDRAFATEILYGTIRWKLRIDYLIQKNINTNIDEVSTWALICIRTAIYQIFYMDKVPGFAAVNQAVEIVKLKEMKAASFVNGILRNILRNKDEFNNIGVKNKTKRLSIEYSHPEWFIRKFQKVYGQEFVTSLMKINNTPPELFARVNTLKISRDDLISKLEAKGYETEKGRIDESVILKGYSMIEKSDEFNGGLFIFQDESSMLVSKILDPKPSETVIDVCSAPGGKTTHIAAKMQNKGSILAFDIHEHKLKLINENANKLGIKIIRTALWDATLLNKELLNYADRVLVDAPCSGLGLIRKKPEIRWNVTEQDIINLSMLQFQILNNASKYLKTGGTLVYSTCTITDEENENVIEQFLKLNPDFRLDNICRLLPENYLGNTSEKGYIKLFPNINKCDGFFIARFKREG